MPKYLLFSDIHIHAHKRSSERLQDCLDVLDWVFKTAQDNEIENILFVGDLFHDRQKIDVFTYQKTFDVFCKYFPGKMNIWLLLGNHDLWHHQKWDVSSVNPLGSIDGVTVVNSPTTIKISGQEISFLPYTHDPEGDLKKLNNNSKTRILCGHVAIDGAVWNVMAGTKAEVSIEHDGDMKKVTRDVFDGWDHVFLGHYHAQQKLDYNVEYIGSPLQLSFGEAFQHKHVIIFNSENGDKQYIRNTFSPQHFIIPAKDISKYSLNKNFLRIMVNNLAASEVVEMRSEILTNNVVGSLEIKQVEKDHSTEEMTIEDAKAILFKETEMISKYVGQEEHAGNLGELDKDKLLEIGNKICEEIS